VIRFTGWVYLDPILSIAIALLIVYSALEIIRESLNILLEGLPRGMNLADITRAMSTVTGVLDVHDLHIWSLGAKTHALSSHVLIDNMPASESSEILKRLNDVLCGFGIHHTTIQFEHVPCLVSDQGCKMSEAAHHDHAH
jgi:cobalt-zinc-cadmium efflux system protein